jgi:hypothetical protein
MKLLDQIKKDLDSYRGVPKCQSIETHREDVTPSKPLVCIVCEDELGQNNVNVLCDSYTHQTEFYCRECYQVIRDVRKSMKEE